MPWVSAKSADKNYSVPLLVPIVSSGIIASSKRYMLSPNSSHSMQLATSAANGTIASNADPL